MSPPALWTSLIVRSISAYCSFFIKKTFATLNGVKTVRECDTIAQYESNKIQTLPNTAVNVFLNFKANLHSLSWDMYRSVFRMGFPRQGWSSHRFRQYRTYNCEKE
jgi:hypothetical protein